MSKVYKTISILPLYPVNFTILLYPMFDVLFVCLAGMEEDGSFIGKYTPKRDPKQSSAFATLV